MAGSVSRSRVAIVAHGHRHRTVIVGCAWFIVDVRSGIAVTEIGNGNTREQVLGLDVPVGTHLTGCLVIMPGHLRLSGNAVGILCKGIIVCQ